MIDIAGTAPEIEGLSEDGYEVVSERAHCRLAALIDRLLRHCHIINIRGNSYRMGAHQDLLQSGSGRRRKKNGS